MLLHSVYSLILLYIRRYTCTHSYIRYLQESPPYYFHYILYIRISSERKQFSLYHSQKLHTCLKTWQRHVTLLQTQDGVMPTTMNTLVNSSHFPITHISVQLLYTAIQSNLIPHKHQYLIYYLQAFLRILKFEYPDLNIVINSSLSSHTLVLYVTPFSSQSLTAYGHPITVLDSSVGKMKNATNGYIETFLLRTLDHGRAMNTTQKHQNASPW